MSELSDRDVQRQRAAKNQSLFREVNKRVENLGGSAFFSTFVCECMDLDCVEKISLSLEEYEHIRSDSNRFVVLPGHEVSEVEEVVESEGGRYLVVSKLGVGGVVAERLDPRSRT